MVKRLYLSIHQAIKDPILAQKLRTLDLPVAVRGSTLPRFEAWWEAHGFKWLKDKLVMGESPLAAHQIKAIDNNLTSPSNEQPAPSNQNNTVSHKNNSEKRLLTDSETDVFADMLADLADEVLHQQI